MNIAILDMDDLKNPFWAAGQARATREVAKLLAKKHTVTVYATKYPQYKDYREDGIEYIHIGIVSQSPRLTNLAYLFCLPFTVRHIKADVIIENFTAPISVSFAPLFTQIPVIGLPTMFAAQEFNKKYHLPFDKIEAFGMKFYKYMMPYSPTDSRKIKQLNPAIRYRIIPQGVAEEFFAIEQKTPKYILFLGRFDIHQKGIDLLLNAYAQVKNTIAYPLVIAGHGPDEKTINQLISELDLADRVTVVGSAYGDKKAKLISEALCAAFPSRHDELSIWSLEALASGLPLVGFDLPESAWATSEVALKSKPFDLDAYSQALVRATQPPLINPMRKQARIFARPYTWDHVAKEFESFIEAVLANEKGIKVAWTT